MSNEEWGGLDQEVREILAAGAVGRHPSDAELTAYARGELSTAEAERLQEHLGPCRRCTAAVLAVELPRLEGAAAKRLSDAEVSAGVEAIVAGIRQPSVARRDRVWIALAAVLAVACVSLALLATQFRRQVGELEDTLARINPASTLPAADPLAIGPPQTGVPIVDLFPSSVARGETTAPPAIRLPGAAAMVALILTPPSGLSHAAYALRIFDAADSELWRGQARPNEAGAFVVVLPRRFVEVAPARISLYGIDGTSEHLVESYPLRFEL